MAPDSLLTFDANSDVKHIYEHYHSLPCNQFLASNANTNADGDVKCEQGFTNKWGIYVDILILQ